MNIELAEYTEEWKETFNLERKVLTNLFQYEAEAIEHIGSTSVQGLNAKPIIDTFLAVSPFREMPYYEDKLKLSHYRYMATGMLNRYLFCKYNADNLWTHNLHILPFDEQFHLRNEILFRDYLRKSPMHIAKYNDLKQQLVGMKYSSLEEYTLAKTQFIQEVVDLARAEKGLRRQDVWTMEYLEEN